MENIRPIKTPEDHAWALAEITRYFDAQPVPGTPDGDRFDVLSDLIAAYEDRCFPMPALSPVDMIKAHMATTGRTQADLATLLGSRPRASEVLNRKRALTVDMIHRLCSEWHIPAECLVKPYHLLAAE